MDTSRLERVLEAEAQGYSAFLTRLPLKLALVKRGQVAALETFLAREAEEQHRLREFERSRTAASAELATALGLPPDSSLSLIIESLPPERASRLASLRRRLVEQSAKIKDGNERCAMLLQASLEFVRYSVELIGGILNPEERLADMIYGPDPAALARSGSVLLNRTA